MECIILTPLGETVLDLSVEDISDLRARAIMKATSPDPSPVPTTPPTRTRVALPEEAAPVGKPRPSRLDAMFGPRETWGRGGSGVDESVPGADHAAHEDEGGPAPYYLHQDEEQETLPNPADQRYSGFLIAKCERCGKIHEFCVKYPGLSHHKCPACGHFTKLASMRPAYMRCEKCGREAKYLTNIQDTKFTINCPNCSEPVTLRLGINGTAFVLCTMKGRFCNRPFFCPAWLAEEEREDVSYDRMEENT